jgi:hypothetical protein
VYVLVNLLILLNNSTRIECLIYCSLLELYFILWSECGIFRNVLLMNRVLCMDIVMLEDLCFSDMP